MRRKINTESTVFERLRMVIGAIAIFAGSMMIYFGLWSILSDPIVLILGVVLFIAGFIIANSPKVADFIPW